jgi:uncharacterized protein (TIGR03435 family)
MRILPWKSVATAAMIAAVSFIPSPALAQTAPAAPIVRMAPAAHPSFAVATIKPHDPEVNGQGFNTTGDRVKIRNQTVASLLSFAYAIHPRQIVDAPEWIFHDRYDIEGTTDTEGEPNLHQFQEMVQKLLADRLQLKFHRDQRELPVYAIRLAKGGSKLKPAADPNAEPNQSGNSHAAEITQTYTNCSITEFVLGMQFFLDRPIVDQTGLTGHYDFSFRYTADETRTTDPNAAPGLFTAVQEQLGLKFEPVKAPTDVFILDRVERPSAN